MFLDLIQVKDSTQNFCYSHHRLIWSVLFCFMLIVYWSSISRIYRIILENGHLKWYQKYILCTLYGNTIAIMLDLLSQQMYLYESVAYSLKERFTFNFWNRVLGSPLISQLKESVSLLVSLATRIQPYSCVSWTPHTDNSSFDISSLSDFF